MTSAELAESHLDDEVTPKRKLGTAALYSQLPLGLAIAEIGRQGGRHHALGYRETAFEDRARSSEAHSIWRTAKQGGRAP